MFTFHVEQNVPKFILRDRNGYALAKAIEAAVQYMNDTIAKGVGLDTDYETMPEWRLDELAWELNCLYDYNANIETKREWIKSAIPMYRLHGTPQAIYKYIGGYFEGLELEENWIYGGEPFHFRVTVDGEWTPENEAWARKAIRTAKNARSVLDGLNIGHICEVGIAAESGVLGKFIYPTTGEDIYTGRWPLESTVLSLDETENTALQADTEDHVFSYPMTGTIPEINMAGTADESGLQGETAEDVCVTVSYKLCGQDEL